VKIVAIETHHIRVPFTIGTAPTEFVGVRWTELETLFVRVVTDTGPDGWGEGFGHACCPATRAAIESQLGPAALGKNARDIRGVMHQLAQQVHLFGRSGPLAYGLSALDVALWDIAGKEAGMPLWRMLGAGSPGRVAAYASLLRYGTPASVAEACRRAVDRGYRHIKLHEVDPLTVGAARDAVGPGIGLMLDTNCPWTVDEAIAIARQLREHDLAWLEEPIWPPEDNLALARVRREGGVPIAAGENAESFHAFRDMFTARAIDIAQPSVAKIGGISPMVRIAALAEAHDVRLVPHCAYFGPGWLASLHLHAALSPLAPFERLYIDLQASPYHDRVLASDGFVTVPDAPGLGLDPDPSVLARYRLSAPGVVKIG
jgi:L-alanine-DL-glutamate epimerase-like enolase superfamily enzyme